MIPLSDCLSTGGVNQILLLRQNDIHFLGVIIFANTAVAFPSLKLSPDGRPNGLWNGSGTGTGRIRRQLDG